jgi:hypothetical protein
MIRFLKQYGTYSQKHASVIIRVQFYYIIVKVGQKLCLKEETEKEIGKHQETMADVLHKIIHSFKIAAFWNMTPALRCYQTHQTTR